MQIRIGNFITEDLSVITINISERVYSEANELDNYLNMGYQNVLKTAMAMGLTELYHQVSSHKMESK